MHPVNAFLQKYISAAVDFFYRPFRSLVPRQLFRYGLTGGANVCFDWVLYFIFYNFVFDKQEVHVGFLAFTPHIASFIFTFPITFLSGFWLARYISFSESPLRGRTQLVRYLFTVLSCIVPNYMCLKLFVEVCGIYPTPSKMLTTVVTTLFSYFMQKHFSFKA